MTYVYVAMYENYSDTWLEGIYETAEKMVSEYKNFKSDRVPYSRSKLTPQEAIELIESGQNVWSDKDTRLFKHIVT